MLFHSTTVSSDLPCSFSWCSALSCLLCSASFHALIVFHRCVTFCFVLFFVRLCFLLFDSALFCYAMFYFSMPRSFFLYSTLSLSVMFYTITPCYTLHCCFMFTFTVTYSALTFLNFICSCYCTLFYPVPWFALIFLLCSHFLRATLLCLFRFDRFHFALPCAPFSSD